MQLDENYLLCNPLFHERFYKTTEVLALILAAAPFSAAQDELLDKTRLAPSQLLPICRALWPAGFIRHHDVFASNWVLNTSAVHLTLEDVFFCVARDFDDGMPGTAAAPATAASALNGVNAFLMQASISTYQCFLKELRRFSLTPLRTGGIAPADEVSSRFGLVQTAIQAMAAADVP